MPRRKVGKENIRNLRRFGTSTGLTIPVKLLRALRWQKKQKVVVKRSGKKLIIQDWPVRKKKRK